ncbi:MAG: hypothetical protein K8R69_02875, partial [Deltaproteobacteria bacterium]|nr:hypothetical protein [Deltaproteobacteria bacterium]
MESDEKTLTLALAAHPGWMSEDFLKAVTGVDAGRLGFLLEDLAKQGKILRGEDERPYWRMSDPSVAENEMRGLDAGARREWHRRLFDFIRGQEDTDPLAGLLAYHAERADLREEAFSWNLRTGQILSAVRNFAEAQSHYRKAFDFAVSPEQSAQALLQIGNLECHLGLFRAAEAPYREALAKLEPLEETSSWIRAAQSLAAALVERGRYAEAHDLLVRSRSRLEVKGMELEHGVISLHLTQVYIGMGMMREADASLREVKGLFADGAYSALAPYEQLLEGKLETIQGRLAPAFRIFEEAARGVETQGDLAGKREVLLSISAPLMEH